MHSRRRGTRRVSQWALFATLVAVSPLEAQAVRDSAGISIVSNERPMLPAARAWRIDERPVLRIGGDDAPPDTVYEFALIMGVSRMSDGRWAVGVQGAHTVRFFDASGKFASSGGRRGEGPGEFQQILGMTNTPGDTLVVIDLGEVEYFDGQGRFIRQGATRRNMAGAGYAWPAGILPGGEFVGFNWNQRRALEGGDGVNVIPFLHVGRVPSQIDTIAIVPLRVYPQGGDSRFVNAVPFGPSAAVTSSATRFWFGFPDRYEVREFDLSSKVVRMIRRSWAPAPVRDAERSGYIAHVRAAAERDKVHPLTPAMRESMNRTLPNLPFAKQFPAFAELKADRAGNLWVQQYDWHFDLMEPGLSRVQTMSVPSRWDVFDPAGRWLCTVTLPARFTPLEIGNDYVAGIARDEDDVERVEVYRLRKP
jgi:hypothetical protein